MEKNFTLSSNVYFISPKEDQLTSRQETDSPSDASIANILGFSKALRVEKSKQTGVVEMVLN